MVEKELKTYPPELANQLKEAGKYEEFLRVWIRSIATGLNQVSKEAAKKILKVCGTNCARIVAEVYNWDLTLYDLDSFVSIMNEHPGDRCEKEKNTVIYEFKPTKCECPLVSEAIIEMSPIQCSIQCSFCFTSWLEHMFGTVTKRPVKAELIESLATGASKCTFRIQLESPR
jgi:predicted hydrocarbon binding protein